MNLLRYVSCNTWACLVTLFFVVTTIVQQAAATVNQNTNDVAHTSITTNVHQQQPCSIQKQHRSNVVATQQRKDQQVDPCDSLLGEVDSCLITANPTCGTCVRTAYEMFLETVTRNITCDEYKAGICPVVYESCLCSPCNTLLESYFNCVLNDFSQNTCPVAYCDPLKDFSAAPEQCMASATAASSCIGYECLSCLRETIDYGGTCTEFQQMTCDAVNLDCLSCLGCKTVIEPWLRCISIEGKACDTFQCDTNSTIISPGVAPTPQNISDDNMTTATPTSPPQASIIDAPTISISDAPAATTPTTITNNPIAPTLRSINTSSANAEIRSKASFLLFTCILLLL